MGITRVFVVASAGLMLMLMFESTESRTNVPSKDRKGPGVDLVKVRQLRHNYVTVVSARPSLVKLFQSVCANHLVKLLQFPVSIWPSADVVDSVIIRTQAT